MFLPVLSGVPEGSRPMLYLIYVDELSHSSKYSHTLISAYDIKCILPILSRQDSINLARTVLISKIISMKSHISVLNGNSFSRNLYT